MPGPRQPLEVLEAKGRKHLSKSEKAARRAGEVRGGGDVKRLAPPSWLPEGQRAEFNRVARIVVQLMPSLVARTDGDTIATYCMARQEWMTATAKANQAMRAGDLKGAQGWGLVQDRYFKQARACANDLGLTISSRCRLVAPEAPERPEDNPFMRMLEQQRARREA